jgi:hypothetical protein
MGRSKRVVCSLIFALLVAGGIAALVLRDSDPAGPFPTTNAIARTGFAAWPVDTPDEARDECAGAGEWRKDPEQVALRFASDVLAYPQPSADTDYARDDEHTYRTLVTTSGVRGVFLGSALTVDRYGECWYVTEGQPREGAMEIDVVTIDGGRRVVVPLGCCGTKVEIGWGGWTKTLDYEDRAGVMVVDAPDEARGESGHFIVTDPDEDGVSEGVGARALPPLPTSEGAEPLAPLDVGRRPIDPALCGVAWHRRGDPERIIRELRRWVFEGGLGPTATGSQQFDSGGRQRVSDFQWRVHLDEADLTFNFARAADRCWLIRSIVPHGPRIVERVSGRKTSFTFDLDPGRADKVVVYYGVGAEAQSVSLEDDGLFGEPFSVNRGPDFPPHNVGLPAYALAITYRDGNMYSAEYGLFEMPPPTP